MPIKLCVKHLQIFHPHSYLVSRCSCDYHLYITDREYRRLSDKASEWQKEDLNPPTLASALDELMKAVGDDKGLKPRAG